MADLNKLADVGASLIDIQFKLASDNAARALYDNWALGYCFGLFDAIAQRASLDQYTEGITLITLGFMNLFSDPLQAASFVSRALDHQTDDEFVSGNLAGGNDFIAWAQRSPSAPPMTLCDHLVAQRPASTSSPHDPSSAS